MDKKMILLLIEATLKEFSKGQVNLGSEQARKILALKILTNLSSKVFMTEYRSQDTFE